MKKIVLGLIGLLFGVHIAYAQHQHHDTAPSGQLSAETYYQNNREEAFKPFFFGYQRIQKFSIGTNCQIAPIWKAGVHFAETKNVDVTIGPSIGNKNFHVGILAGVNIGKQTDFQLGSILFLEKGRHELLSINQLWGRNRFSVTEYWLTPDKNLKKGMYSFGIEAEYLQPSNETILLDDELLRTGYEFGIGPITSLQNDLFFLKLGCLFLLNEETPRTKGLLSVGILLPYKE